MALSALSHPVLMPRQTIQLARFAVSGIDKVVSLTIKHFDVLRNLALAGFGIKECVLDQYLGGAKQLARPITAPILTTGSPHSDNSLQTHGALFLGSGICGVAATTTTKSVPPWKSMANALFFFANVLSLEEACFRLAQSFETPPETAGQYRKTLQNRTAATLTILSSLAYITMALLTVLETAALMAAVLCGIGTLTGCLAILVENAELFHFN